MRSIRSHLAQFDLMFLFHIHRSTIECPALVSAGKALIDSGHSGSGHSAKLTGKLALLNMPLIQSEAGAGFSFGGGGRLPGALRYPHPKSKTSRSCPPIFSKRAQVIKKEKNIIGKTFISLTGPVPGLKGPVPGMKDSY